MADTPTVPCPCCTVNIGPQLPRMWGDYMQQRRKIHRGGSRGGRLGKPCVCPRCSAPLASGRQLREHLKTHRKEVL